MSKTNTDTLTLYQRAAIEWFDERPRVTGCTINFSQAEKPDKIDKWLVANVPHYAEVLCKALKIPVGGEEKICRVTNCGQPVENPMLDTCNRCFEEITAGEDNRDAVLWKAIEQYSQENLHDEEEDR